MRVAIHTDLHSNLPALEAVLAAIDEDGIEQRWCLGDVVGYGAQPDECAKLVSERCEVSLVGNHDLAVTGEIDTDVFSASAAAAVEWTRANAVLAIDQARECIEEQSGRVSLIGQSHVALWFSDGDGPPGGDGGGQAEGGREIDLSEGRWLLNPGSVGQPRDGDSRAAWLELDTDSWTASYHRTNYDIDAAAEAIRDAGLPELLADRLYIGQ